MVLLEAVAAGPDGFVAVSGSLAAATVARHAEVPVWRGGGRPVAPAAHVDGADGPYASPHADPWDLDEEIVPFDLVDQVCGPGGLEPSDVAVGRTDCPVAPELFDRGNAPGTYRG